MQELVAEQRQSQLAQKIRPEEPLSAQSASVPLQGSLDATVISQDEVVIPPVASQENSDFELLMANA